MFSVRQLFTMLAIAISIAGLMAFLSGVPPFSMLYNWLAHDMGNFVWYGLTAGIIALSLTLYGAKVKKKKEA